MTVELRPLAATHAAAVQPLAAAAFDELDVRQGRPPRGGTPEVREHYRRGHEHLLATGRGLGAFDGEALVGVALSYERAGTWVLALLVVQPGQQSDGTGSALLRAALRVAAARAGDGGVDVGPLAPQEHWAVDVAVEARLDLVPCGPVALAGAADPLAGPCPPAAVLV